MTHECNSAAAGLLAFGVPNFGAVVYDLRVEQARSQLDVAQAAGLSMSYWSSIENGRRPPPRRKTALRMARALGLSPIQTLHFTALAEGERAASLHDALLPVAVRQIMSLIRLHAHRMTPQVLEGMRSELSRLQQADR